MKVASSAVDVRKMIAMNTENGREESAFPPPELLQRAVISFLLQLFQYSLMQSIYKTDNLFFPWNILEICPWK